MTQALQERPRKSQYSRAIRVCYLVAVPSQQTFQSTRPVSGPLARALHNIDEFPRDNAISLLARVKLVVPKVAVWACLRNAMASRDAVIDVAGHVERRCAVEVLRRIVVDVGQLRGLSACGVAFHGP